MGVRKLFHFLVIISFILLNPGCKKNPTEPIETLVLSIEDVSCTEAWVKISTTNSQTPNTLILFVNEKANQSIALVGNDTLLYVDSLLPNQSYKIKAAFVTNNQLQPTNEVVATTMDTTTHNFTWQTITFGEHSSSVLYDVAIIDENDIWAVGEIFMNDSLGKPDPIAYNAAHWNGSKWEVKKISVLYNGNQTVAPLEGVFALPTCEIIFTSGLPYLPQTNGWKLYHLWDMGVLNQNDGGVTKIWGTSINDLYFVGRKGTIVHYDGKSWQKIESGTTTNINDIYGTADKNGKQRIFCAVTNVHNDGDIKLLKIDENKKVEDIPITVIGEQGYTISSVWTDKRKTYFCGDGVFASSDDLLFKEVKVNDRYKYRIRGNGVNDVYMVDYGGMSHYNGSTWSEIYPWGLSYLRSGAVKGQIAAACGEQGSKAVIIILNH